MMNNIDYQIDRLAKHPDKINELADFMYDGFGKYYTDASVDKYRHRLIDSLQDDEVPFYIVCLMENEPVGMAGLYERWGNERTADFTPWFGALYVTPSERRKGVGRLLFEAIESECRWLGIQNIYLHTPNKSKLYVSWGWKTIDKLYFTDRTENIMEFRII